MNLLLAVCLVTQAPEAEMFEEDISLPTGYTWSEVLAELQADPLDLNSAPAVELLEIPFLSPSQARSIVALRESSGRLTGYDQLLTLPGFSPELLDQLRPYTVILPGPEAAPRLAVYARSYLDRVPPGSARSFRLAERVTWSSDSLQVGLVSAKGAEELNAVDFLALGASCAVRSTRFFGGSYGIHAGQGLVFSAPHSFSVPADAQRIPEPATVSLPRTFADNSLLQGLGWQQQLGPMTAILFASRSQLDAVVNADSSVRSITWDGIHIDSAELAGRHYLTEDLAGARAGWQQGGLGVGLTGWLNRYSHAISPESGSTGFRGQDLAVMGSDLAWHTEHYLLGVEVGHSLRSGWAGALNLYGDWRAFRTRLNLLYLDQTFYSPHSRSRTLRRTRNTLEGTFRADYRFADWDAGLSGSTERDFLFDSMPARLELALARKADPLSVSLRWRQSYKDELSRTGGARLDIGWRFLPQLSITGRMDDRFLLSDLSHRGLLLAASADCEFRAVDARAGVSHFAVNDAACRVYAYEPGLPGSSVSFTGSGWRGFVAANLRPLNWLSVSAKFGVTWQNFTTCDAGLSLSFRY